MQEEVVYIHYQEHPYYNGLKRFIDLHNYKLQLLNITDIKIRNQFGRPDWILEYDYWVNGYKMPDIQLEDKFMYLSSVSSLEELDDKGSVNLMRELALMVDGTITRMVPEDISTPILPKDVQKMLNDLLDLYKMYHGEKYEICYQIVLNSEYSNFRLVKRGKDFQIQYLNKFGVSIPSQDVIRVPGAGIWHPFIQGQLQPYDTDHTIVSRNQVEFRDYFKKQKQLKKRYLLQQTGLSGVIAEQIVNFSGICLRCNKPKLHP